MELIPVAAWLQARKILGREKVGILGTNLAHGSDISFFLFIIIILYIDKIHVIKGSDMMNIHPVHIKYECLYLPVKCSQKQDNLSNQEVKALEKYSVEA
jgi:hypothetical protein